MSAWLDVEGSATESVCPQCLRRIPAIRVARGKDVWLKKECPEHGEFQAVLWRGDPSHGSWAWQKTPFHPKSPHTSANLGCPYDCGLCPDHRQQTCTGVIEVTQRCDLRCSICYADSGGNGALGDPDLGTIEGWYRALLANGHFCNIQLSGGEPTLRSDLPEIVALGRSMGFSFIQLNTNGVRMGRDKAFVERLKKAGLSSVFLQFDGTKDTIHEAMRGMALSEAKEAAIRNCESYELGVVLVATLLSGVNTNSIGEIIRFALQHIPPVRGVHFQPMSFFGRYPGTPSDEARITIPEVIRAIEEQTAGLINAEAFKPPGCENAFCSFHGNFVLMPDGHLENLTRHGPSCCCRPASAAEGASKARDFVTLHWSFPVVSTPCADERGLSLGAWDVLLERAKTHMLCISGMAFQDAWNLDLDRLRDCCIHVVSPDGRLIPFCAYNLTDSQGRSLYRGSAR
jgi:7,8-dihydro-6-hydroxymethylpterin dimethyltransferase